MAGEIRYNVTGMREQAQKLKTLGDSLQDEAERLHTIIGNLEGNWSGEEYTTFLNEYETFKGHQENFAQMVVTFGTYIDTTATRAEEADSEMSKQAANLIG